MRPAEHLALWADTLRDIAAGGLRYASHPIDRENYHTIQTMAMEMMALATGQTLEALEPLRATIFARSSPIAVGDAAIFNAEGQILLIRRADNGCWAMPGGLFNVGETPAQGVVREALEETGVLCRPLHLAAVHDSRLCGTTAAQHLYHFLFVCEPVPEVAPVPPSHGFEILEQGWFSEADLPVNLDPGHISRIPEAFRLWRGDCRAYFDKE